MNLAARLQHAVRHEDGVVLARGKDVATSARTASVGGGRLDEIRRVDPLEGTVEAVEDAIELHAHLVGERPAGVVVGRNRRTAGRGEVVRVILRLEHVDHVGPEGLRGLHH